MLDADIQLRLSRLNLDTAFTVASGEVLALLGPNGSGKSTTLRALVGLLPLAGGRIVLDGTVLEDPAQRIKIPPEQRPINLMFQDYLLFPHLSAIENVAFGLRAKVRMDGTPSITGEVPPAAVDELKLDHGGELWASVDPAAITVYPP